MEAGSIFSSGGGKKGGSQKGASYLYKHAAFRRQVPPGLPRPYDANPTQRSIDLMLQMSTKAQPPRDMSMVRVALSPDLEGFTCVPCARTHRHTEAQSFSFLCTDPISL